MTIIDYFKSENKQFWINQLLKSHWSAATILTNLLKKILSIVSWVVDFCIC